MSNGLRLTDTNSADDSQGQVWFLEGNLFIPFVASFVFSIFITILLYSIFHIGILVAIIFGSLPFVLTLAYLLLFKQGKPPGYSQDVFELFAVGKGFEFNQNIQPPPDDPL